MRLPECWQFRAMITSTASRQMKNLSKLCQKSKARREQGVFVVEGEKMFREMPRDWLSQVYVSESYYKKKGGIAFDTVPYEIVDDAVFKAVSDTVTPQGILCVVKQPSYSLDKLQELENPCFLLLEDIQDPGNLGTMMRTGEGAGVSAVIMSKGCVDIFNPKTIRSTMGSVYRVPFLYVDELGGVVEQLKMRGIGVYAAHLRESVDYDQISYKEGCAFLVGNEGNGLSEELSRKATCCVKIPMQGQVESLNAGVAASILMYEAYRQRR